MPMCGSEGAALVFASSAAYATSNGSAKWKHRVSTTCSAPHALLNCNLAERALGVPRRPLRVHTLLYPEFVMGRGEHGKSICAGNAALLYVAFGQIMSGSLSAAFCLAAKKALLGSLTRSIIIRVHSPSAYGSMYLHFLPKNRRVSLLSAHL